MKTYYRYVKPTIRKQAWECLLTEHEDGTFELNEDHINRSTEKVLKSVTKTLTEKEAMDYRTQNIDWLWEKYRA